MNEKLTNALGIVAALLVVAAAAYTEIEDASTPEGIERRRLERERLEKERQESQERMTKANEAIGSLTEIEKFRLGIKTDEKYQTPATWTAEDIKSFDRYYSLGYSVGVITRTIGKPMDEVAERINHYKSLGL